MWKIFTSIFGIGVLVILIIAYLHARSNMLILPFTLQSDIIANINWMTTISSIIFLGAGLIGLYKLRA